MIDQDRKYLAIITMIVSSVIFIICYTTDIIWIKFFLYPISVFLFVCSFSELIIINHGKTKEGDDKK